MARPVILELDYHMLVSANQHINLSSWNPSALAVGCRLSLCDIADVAHRDDASPQKTCSPVCIFVVEQPGWSLPAAVWQGLGAGYWDTIQRTPAYHHALCGTTRATGSRSRSTPGRGGMLLEEPDGKGECLFADVSAQTCCDRKCGPECRVIPRSPSSCAYGRPSVRGKMPRQRRLDHGAPIRSRQPHVPSHGEWPSAFSAFSSVGRCREW